MRRLIVSFIINAYTIWRGIECWYLVGVANRREAYINRLRSLVGHYFFEAEERVTSVYSHTQHWPGYAHDQWGNEQSGICWEAPVCITVFLDDRPVVGMAVEFRGPVLCIRQLQGAPGMQIPESLRKWPHLFVKAAQSFLHNTKEISSLRLYTAEERMSFWFPSFQTNNTRTTLEEHQRRLKRRYNGTARQGGFKRTHESYWEWDLSMLP